MNSPKLAIFTIVCGDKFKEIWKRTEPFFNAYAEKCNADLLVLKEIPENLPSPHWAKFSIHELLKKQYDRIAFIDADIIIRPDAPNIFNLVPEDQFGIFNEGNFVPRAVCIYEVKKVFNVNLPKWDGKTYYNTGVMVVSREHRHIFKVEEEIKPLRNSFGEQTYLNMKIIHSQVKVFPLSFRYNRMSMMDRINGMTRLDCFFVHYAGDGDKLFEKMDRDIKRWEEDAPEYKYKRKVFVWALGGLGDCVCAEPVIRNMKEDVYKDADIYVMSNHGYLYEHIEGLIISKEREYPKEEIDAVYECYTHPSPLDKFNDYAISYGNFCPHLLVHAVDWISMNTMNRMMPLKDREIKLTYQSEDLQRVLDIESDLEDLVLIHAGMGWETKTFPLEWWQEIVDGLDAAGIRVGLIGKNVTKVNGYVPVVCPPNGVDFRDRLPVQSTIALISKASVVVSNDSAPIHIAGAFDNHIILIPVCKEGDLLLPYRKGQQYYKAKWMNKREMHQDQPARSTDVNGWQTSHFPAGHTVWDYIPDAKDVLKQAIRFYTQSKGHLKCVNKKMEEKENESTFQYRNNDNRINAVQPHF
jgi:lipopolysaccharide biosynthesis glycosyltransferase